MWEEIDEKVKVNNNVEKTRHPPSEYNYQAKHRSIPKDYFSTLIGTLISLFEDFWTSLCKRFVCFCIGFLFLCTQCPPSTLLLSLAPLTRFPLSDSLNHLSLCHRFDLPWRIYVSRYMSGYVSGYVSKASKPFSHHGKSGSWLAAKSTQPKVDAIEEYIVTSHTFFQNAVIQPLKSVFVNIHSKQLANTLRPKVLSTRKLKTLRQLLWQCGIRNAPMRMQS